jgi:AcrR family transcriptional regulator
MKPMKMELKKIAKRADILEAALALASENGLNDTPMSVLAKRAGVAAGTIYLYFPGKTELLNELYKELNSRIHAAMVDGYVPSRPVKKRFDTICRNLLLYYLENPTVLKFIGQYIYTPHIAERTYSRIYSDSLAPLVEFFREAARAKALKDLPIEMIFSFIHGPVDTLVRQHIAGRIRINNRIINLTVETCWDALRRRNRD